MNSPTTSVTPAGNSETPRSRIAVTAPSSRISFPRGVEAWASQRSREFVFEACASKNVPNSSPAITRSDWASEVRSIGIPALVAMRAASTLVTIPPLPTPAEPAPPSAIPSISAICATLRIAFAPL